MFLDTTTGKYTDWDHDSIFLVYILLLYSHAPIQPQEQQIRRVLGYAKFEVWKEA